MPVRDLVLDIMGERIIPCIEGVLSEPAEGCMFLTGGGQIMEIIDTGDLKRITYENTEDVTSTRIFQGIYGVGKYSLLFPAG